MFVQCNFQRRSFQKNKENKKACIKTNDTDIQMQDENIE